MWSSPGINARRSTSSMTACPERSRGAATSPHSPPASAKRWRLWPAEMRLAPSPIRMGMPAHGEGGRRDRGTRGESDEPSGRRPLRGRARRDRRRAGDGGSCTRDHLRIHGQWAACPPSHPFGEGGQAAAHEREVISIGFPHVDALRPRSRATVTIHGHDHAHEHVVRRSNVQGPT